MRIENQSVIKDVLSKLFIIPLSTTHLDLVTKIAEYCLGVKGVDLTHQFMTPRSFSVGEYCPRFALEENKLPNLQGKSVYMVLIPSPYKRPEELIERAQIGAFAAKEHYADKVVLLTTEFPHARQDRGWEEDMKAWGEPTTVRAHARLLKAAGVDEAITTHIHSPRIPAYFALEWGLVPKELLPPEAREFPPSELKVPQQVDVKNIQIQEIGKKVFKSISPHAFLADYILHQSSLVNAPYLKEEGKGLVLKALDKGNRGFIDQLYDALFLPNASRIYCNKARTAKNDPNSVSVEVVEISPHFDTLDGKIELYADDGIETGGTQMRAAEWSDGGNKCNATGKSYGVPADRLIYFTHPWLGGEAHLSVQERLVKGIRAREFITTNTRPYINDAQYHRFKEKSTVLRFAELWADALIANELGHDLEARYSGFSCEEEQHEFISSLYNIKRHSWHFLVEGRQKERKEIIFRLREY